MAVSGRKISEFKDSVSKGSAEDFEHSCVPCLSDDQHVEAHGNCVDCHKYLCKNCLHCHEKTKASKHHQLIDTDKVNKHATTGLTSDFCMEKCRTHSNQVIKFFCPTHEELGCNDCKTMNHRTCDIEYIPDKCAGIGDTDYIEIMCNLEKKLKETDVISKEASNRIHEIDVWHFEIIREITKLRKEINDHLNALQEKIETDAAKRKSSDEKDVNAVLDVCATLTSNIKKFKSNLVHYKEARQNRDLFITIKRAEPSIHSGDVQRAATVLRKTTARRFECNKVLENILSTDSFGQLIEQSTNEAAATQKLISHSKLLHAPKGNSVLSHKEDINVRMETDKRKCGIYGCAVLPSDKLVLTDHGNQKLKVVDISMKAVVDEKTLDSKPFDVTVLPEHKIAVTMPEKKEILIMSTSGNLATSRSIKVQGCCRGITYHQGHLYVVCSRPASVLVLDTKGNVKDAIILNNEYEFAYPWYIELSHDRQLLYISDSKTTVVGSITLQGEISSRYNGIKIPRGLLMLDDGSLLVCSFWNSSIHQLQDDLKQSHEVGTGLNYPMSICCSPEKREVYVGGEYCDQLKVFSLQS